MNCAFLHGGGQGDWVWHDVVEALRLQSQGEALNLLLLNAPGCGAKRDRNTDGLTLEDVAHELVEDVQRRGLKDVVLVGHSQAGQAMALMMAARPELFRRFVYVSCSIPLPGQSVQQMIGNSVQGTNPDEVGWPLDPQTTTIEERYSIMFCNDMDAGTVKRIAPASRGGS
jgi:pimeloyl-ACP methyl ester carboxylesterase